MSTLYFLRAITLGRCSHLVKLATSNILFCALDHFHLIWSAHICNFDQHSKLNLVSRSGESDDIQDLSSSKCINAKKQCLFLTYMIMRNKIKLDLKLNLELSSISIPLNKFYEKWSSSGSHCYHSVVYNYIADICHNHHNRQWCTFSSRVSFLHREREFLAYFGQFWLFCCEFCEFTHFLVYFYMAK